MAERDSSDVRELRLEGVGLFLMVAVLGAGLVGAFFLGRWYERSSAPPVGLDTLASDPLENVVAPGDIEDVDAGAGTFDKIAGETEAEPSRQAQPPVQTTTTPPPAKSETPPQAAQQPSSSQGATGGPFFVQIAAFRDRDAANQMVSRLSGAGYPTQIFADESGGAGRLFKVRVGGYSTRDEAVTIAAELNSKGHEGAFPIKAD